MDKTAWRREKENSSSDVDAALHFTEETDDVVFVVRLMDWTCAFCVRASSSEMRCARRWRRPHKNETRFGQHSKTRARRPHRGTGTTPARAEKKNPRERVERERRRWITPPLTSQHPIASNRKESESTRHKKRRCANDDKKHAEIHHRTFFVFVAAMPFVVVVVVVVVVCVALRDDNILSLSLSSSSSSSSKSSSSKAVK